MTHRMANLAEKTAIGTAVDANHKLHWQPIPAVDGMVGGVAYWIVPERLLENADYAPVHAGIQALPHRILFDTTLTDGQAPDVVWRDVQRPSIDGVDIAERCVTVAAASSPEPADPRSPGTATMKIELRPGEFADIGGGTLTSRCEAYGRFPDVGSTIGAFKWPDPPGCERYYGLKIYIPPDFFLATSTLNWRVLSQWKSQWGASAPLALEIQQSHWSMAGGIAWSRANIGDVTVGEWVNYVFKVVHSNDANIGRLAVWRNGIVVLADHPRRTMLTTSNTVQNGTDPGYWKVGLYRWGLSPNIDILHYGPSMIAYRLEALEDAGYME